MASRLALCILFFYILLLSQVNQLHSHVMKDNNGDMVNNIFFRINDLKLGKKIPVYLPPKKDPSTSPHFLSREEADSIPFSLSKLPQILRFLSLTEGSPQATAVELTLRHCETPPIRGETKFCATSLESMLDSAGEIFGLGAKFEVLTTTHVSESESSVLYQNYTVLEPPEEMVGRKMVACHPMPYPYAVFYCHGQATANRLFRVALAGERGGRVEAAASCHMDTSRWNSDHIAFKLLGIQPPGSSPVCHFFPADNLVWVSAGSRS